MFHNEERSSWVRLRTLVLLRWVAIAGQTIALFVATQYFGLRFELGYAAILVGLSVLTNLFSSFLFPENRRLSEREAAWLQTFDIVQLSLLLMVTGGLNNPFALLILAPVTIAATMLHLTSMVGIGLLAICLMTFVGWFHYPIRLATGEVLSLPPFLQFGFWLALVIGIVFTALYSRRVTREMQKMSDALVATQMALSREQQLTDIGGVIAATAHELGTPLATIKLASSELFEDLSDQPDLRADALLIKEQAERCRAILHAMGPSDKDDLQSRKGPVEAVVGEAAAPHMDRGIVVSIDVPASHAQPHMPRKPEIIHGLRNLIQNAVDFAEAKVVINITWSDTEISIRIQDDGPGYPSSMLGRIGDPFVKPRRAAREHKNRTAYKGMGLGLFIAKTLLERTGGVLRFANVGRQSDQSPSINGRHGAVVTVSWERIKLDQIS